MRMLGRGRVPELIRARMTESTLPDEDKRLPHYIVLDRAYLHPQHLQVGDVIAWGGEAAEVVEIGLGDEAKTLVAIKLHDGDWTWIAKSDMVHVLKARWEPNFERQFSQRDGSPGYAMRPLPRGEALAAKRRGKVRGQRLQGMGSQ